MGSCVGRCLPKGGSSNQLSRQDSAHDFSYLVEEENSEITFQDKDNTTKRTFLSRLFSKRKNRKKKAPVLQLVDGIMKPQNSNPYSRLNESRQISKTSSYASRDIPLQCLDARALLARTATSTPASSLDLEWEHETIPISFSHIQDTSNNSWIALPECNEQELEEDESSNKSTNQGEGRGGGQGGGKESDSDWSRVSSANSLEWDNVQSSLHSPLGEELTLAMSSTEIDPDTQLLLSEIERLTSQTLRETGQEFEFS